MKRSFLLSLCGSFLITGTSAQPILTQATNGPAPGSTFDLNYSAYTTPGAGGAGATWDLSAIAVDSTDVVQWVIPSSTPNGALFPTADVAELWDVISYSQVIASGLFVIGSDEQGVIVTYSDARQALAFPCTYLTSWSDPFTATYTVIGMNVTRSGTYGGTADGYGTLIMPWGSVPDVLRIHVQATQSDVSPFGSVNVTIDSYQYFAVGTAWPVLEVVSSTATSIGGTFTVEYTLWMNNLNTAVQQQPGNNDGLPMWPNPADADLTITRLTEGSAARWVRIHDLDGRIVLEINVAAHGSGDIHVDLTSLQAGAYMVTVEDVNGQRKQAPLVVGDGW